MTAIRGGAAAVTGAASGIGRALALELAARGCDLALADRDEAGLQAVAAEIGRTHSRKVTLHRVDVGEANEIEAFAQAAVPSHPGLNILINNAAVPPLAHSTHTTPVPTHHLIHIHFFALIPSTRA